MRPQPNRLRCRLAYDPTNKAILQTWVFILYHVLSTRLYSGTVRTLTTWLTASLTFPCSAIELVSINAVVSLQQQLTWIHSRQPQYHQRWMASHSLDRSWQPMHSQLWHVLRLVHIGIASPRTQVCSLYFTHYVQLPNSFPYFCLHRFHHCQSSARTLCCWLQVNR